MIKLIHVIRTICCVKPFLTNFGTGMRALVLPTNRGGNFTVRFFDSTSTQVATSGPQVLHDNEFRIVNFVISAHPVIYGFVMGQSGAGVAGATVKICQGPRLVASTTTDSGGYYVLSLSQGGLYPVKITPPTGYKCVTQASVKLSLGAPQEIRCDFILKPE